MTSSRKKKSLTTQTTRTNNQPPPPSWETFLAEISRHIHGCGAPAPAVDTIHRRWPGPYSVLVSTLISLRTKDSVTLQSSARLLEKAPTLEDLAALDTEQISQALYPAGFYRRKSQQLAQIAQYIMDHHHGRIPDTRETLLALPGVGIKTANLVLGIGFSIPAICVDIHVHRIVNRCGLVSTSSPEETLSVLEKTVPRDHWIDVNQILVPFGQTTCSPVSPRCSTCPLADWCPRTGVTNSR